MPNYYQKSKKMARSTMPGISNVDIALKDPYKRKDFDEDLGTNLLKPGDQSGSMGGADYDDNRHPPEGISAREMEPSSNIIPSDHDGEDSEMGDRKPEMSSSDAFLDGPLSSRDRAVNLINKKDRDNSSIGPHNMSRKMPNFFDNITRRVRN